MQSYQAINNYNKLVDDTIRTFGTFTSYKDQREFHIEKNEDQNYYEAWWADDSSTTFIADTPHDVYSEMG